MKECPVTRVNLQSSAYPVVMMKRKLTNWRVVCFDRAIEIAYKLVESPEEYTKACSLAESILNILGEDTYMSRSGRLAKLLLKDVESKEPMQ
jgi:hypothetical protein